MEIPEENSVCDHSGSHPNHFMYIDSHFDDGKTLPRWPDRNSSCWEFLLGVHPDWWKPSMFFWTGEGQLKKIWHQEYNAVEKQKVIDRKLRNMEHRKVSLFGGGWFFPLILHRLKGWLSFLLGLKMRQLDQALKLALIFFRGNMAETHLKDSEKHILSFRARVPHFGGTTSQERFTWVDLFMYCIFWGFLVFVRMLNTLVNNLFSKLFIEDVENHQINLAQVVTGRLIYVDSWRLCTRFVRRFLDSLAWNWTRNGVWLLL